jgi:hypothetical protein
MSKRSFLSAAFSVIIITMLCLFPSVVGAQTTQEQQQKDPPPPKKSRSNINNNRTGVGRFDPIMIHLGKASGASVATRKIVDADSDGKISEAEGIFDFGVLPAGDYELRFSDADGHSDATANRGITINTSHVEYSANKKVAGNAAPKHNSDVDGLSVILTGVVGGPLNQELQAQITTGGDELSRPGKTKFKNIVLFKADGRSHVKGTLKGDASTPELRNRR